jgi:RNA polymerase sigma-70 factor (ECF subfamily)
MTDTTDRLYERVLVLRCQSGDESAFAELVERYQPRLRYFLRKMLGEMHGAEDALQEVWLSVFRAVSRLADAGAFRVWLYRLARDRAWGELRKRRLRHQPIETVEVADEVAEDANFTAEEAERIHAALDQLSIGHREALALRFIEDMTYEEMAQAIGCEVGTVRSRLHYAKRALRDVLERTNVHDGEGTGQGPAQAGHGAGNSGPPSFDPKTPRA